MSKEKRGLLSGRESVVWRIVLIVLERSWLARCLWMMNQSYLSFCALWKVTC